MKPLVRTVALLMLSLGIVAKADDGSSWLDFTDAERRLIDQFSPLPPLPPDPTNRVADDPTAARLGQFLFFDEALSRNGQVSCATCHDPRRAFADGKPVGQGIGTLERHSPTLWNAAYNRWQFWDGRADTLWMQALHPIENPLEMGATRTAVAHRVYADKSLRKTYETIFGALPALNDTKRFPAAARPTDEPDHAAENAAWQAMSPEDRRAIDVVFTNVAKAIAAYERLLVSRDAPFDRFVRQLHEADKRDEPAISLSAQRGLRLFIGRGNCRLCHSGPNFSDGEFHNNRVPPRGGGTPTDAGRYGGIPQLLASPFNAKGEFSDAPHGTKADMLDFLKNKPDNWGAVKTPTLRNVARTAPYMHQGQFETLHDVLNFYSTLENAVSMGHHAKETILVPLGLTPQEFEDLTAFLESLTDESIDASLLTQPKSPQ